MVRAISTAAFLQSNLPLVDVRSPGEFSRGHIPGAVNIPLFSDAERKVVGTIYTRESPEKALETGLHYVKPKLESFLIRSGEVAPDGAVAVHCWRGGMRSHKFAGHLSENQFKEVFVIDGGYKAFRQHLLSFFKSPFELRLIGGYTGSGKTDLLHLLKKTGHQGVDLEELACHRGSSFGGIGMGDQPTTEQFENDLFIAFRTFDLTKPIWLEDESHNIGGVNIPGSLYEQMKTSPVFFLDIPIQTRAGRLVREYAQAAPEEIAAAINRIAKRLGGENTKEALRLLDEKRFPELATLLLSYYDKSYRKSLLHHDPEKIYPIGSVCDEIEKNSQLILNIHEAYTEYQTYFLQSRSGLRMQNISQSAGDHSE